MQVVTSQQQLPCNLRLTALATTLAQLLPSRMRRKPLELPLSQAKRRLQLLK